MTHRLCAPVGVLVLCLPSVATAATTHYRNVLDVSHTDASALCNDGSVPIFYVHKGTTQPDRWLLYLEGGSSCNSVEECDDRWLTGARDKMGSGCVIDATDHVVCDQTRGAFDPSGGFTPPGDTKNLDGALDAVDARNPFVGWTHVYFDYCSSDTWAGQDAVLPTEYSANYTGMLAAFGVAPPLPGFPIPAAGAPGPADFLNLWISDLSGMGWSNAHYGATFDKFNILFNGHNIVDRVVDQLSAGALVVGPGGEVDPELSLANATHVILTGSSAGGAGVRQNLDFVGDKLAVVAPDSLYRGIIEAAYTGGLAAPDPGQVAAWPAISESVAGGWNGSGLRTFIWGAYVDESCAARTGASATFPYAANSEYIRCGDFSELIAGDDLATPFFARHALWDRVTRPTFAPGAVPTAPLADQERMQQQEIEYGGWHLGQETELGGFYFDCDQDHVELSQAAFYAEPMDSLGFPGSNDTFAEVVDRWLHGDVGAHRASMGCTP